MNRAAVVWCAASFAVASACGAGSSTNDIDDAHDQPTGTMLVLAAASLSTVFGELADAVEEAHPGLQVDVSFGASSALGVQIEEGAPADVFAAASPESMARLVEQGLLAEPPITFATNSLVIAVPLDNPGGVDDLGDFERESLALGACAEQVPCGAYAASIFDDAGIEPRLDTREIDVRGVVAKLVAGELDAGIVYATDVAADPKHLLGIDLASGTAEAEYPIAPVAGAPNRAGADAFIDIVMSDTGRSILTGAGFGAP